MSWSETCPFRANPNESEGLSEGSGIPSLSAGVIISFPQRVEAAIDHCDTRVNHFVLDAYSHKVHPHA